MATFAENRKARAHYEILETFQAGLALNGQEVKSMKSGRGQLAGAYVQFRRLFGAREELFLVGANIPPYQPANAPAHYNPERTRKLLVRKAELRSLIGKSKEKGLTLVPLKVYSVKGKLKLQVGLARGKKKYDKREDIKRRAAQREIERALKYGDARF